MLIPAELVKIALELVLMPAEFAEMALMLLLMLSKFVELAYEFVLTPINLISNNILRISFNSAGI